MRHALFCLLLLPFFTLSSGAGAHSSPPPPSFSIEDLSSLVAKTEATTIEGFLPSLPASFRRNPVLMRHSRSAQPATPDRPRVMMTNADASFIATFSGDAYQGGGMRLELMQFHEKEARFEFAEVDFEDGKKPTMIRNSNSCGGCHGNPSDLRPNWESFSNWVGAYGETDEKLTSSERRELESFVARAKTHPRYRAILDLKATHLEKNTDGTLAGNANSNLNLNLNRLNAKRVARLVGENEDYARKKYSILASLYCSTKDAKDFVARFFPQVKASDVPASFVSIEEDSSQVKPAAFFWAALPKNSRMFSWTTSFGDMMNQAAVRTRHSASLDYAEALLAADADLRNLRPKNLKPGVANLPSCEDLERLAAQAF